MKTLTAARLLATLVVAGLAWAGVKLYDHPPEKLTGTYYGTYTMSAMTPAADAVVLHLVQSGTRVGGSLKSEQPPMSLAAPRSMKSVGGIEGIRRGGDREVEFSWCSEPVEQSDHGDPEHHSLLPPSGEHVGESTPNAGCHEPPQGARTAMGMKVLYEGCAGCDVHKKMVTVHVIVPEGGETRTYGTTTTELLGLVEWLLVLRVTHVAMESTGVYWKPLYNLLESTEMTVYVVNAAHMKAVPGRKTDIQDAMWICDLMQHGLRMRSLASTTTTSARRTP